MVGVPVITPLDGLIDSPVGKTVEHAVAGTSTLMIGGDAAVIERVRPVLKTMGAELIHCGGLGMGQAMKLTNNLLATVLMAASAEALVAGADFDMCDALADQRGHATLGERMLERRREGRLDRRERRFHRAAAALAHPFGRAVASRSVAVRRDGGHRQRLAGFAPGRRR